MGIHTKVHIQQKKKRERMEKLIAEYTKRKHFQPIKINSNKADCARTVVAYKYENADCCNNAEKPSAFDLKKREEINARINYFVRKLRIAKRQMNKRKEKNIPSVKQTA